MSQHNSRPSSALSTSSSHHPLSASSHHSSSKNSHNNSFSSSTDGEDLLKATNGGTIKYHPKDVYNEGMTETPNEYYCNLINQWLEQYTTTVQRRVNSIVDCSPSLFIILYESISKDNPNSNPKEYPKYIRDKTLTLSQNQYNLIELLTYLKLKYKHSFILRNIDEKKILDRNVYEIIKLLDWFIQLEQKRVHAYIPQLDDPNFQDESNKNEMTESFSIRHRKKMLKIQRDNLEREHNAFIKKAMRSAQAKEESLLRDYLTHSNRIEKETLILSVNSLKKKETEMSYKLQDRKDSINNL